MTEPIEIVPYDSGWPDLFRQTALPMREALDSVALRIDHIGSTSIVGLAAKPVIDIQISVVDFEPMAAFRDPLQELGYVFRSKNDDRTKRYFREAPGTRRTHIHVRRQGSLSQQLALVFRDYLREHPEDAARYADLKYQLMETYHYERQLYTDAKDPFIWEIMQKADKWAQRSGWQPGKTDI